MRKGKMDMGFAVLKHSGPRTWLVVAALIALALVPPVALGLNDPFYIRFVTRIMIFAIAAVSLDLILGYGGMVCLGQAAFIGLGAYTVGILSFHRNAGEPLMTWPITIAGTNEALIAWPAAILIAAFAALVIGALSLRTRGVYFIMLTLAFAQMLFYFFLSLSKYGGEDGLRLANKSQLGGIDLNNRVVFYYLVFGILLAILFIVWKIIHSRFGSVIRGSEQNERRMHAIGIPVFRYRLVCFVIAGAMSGLAGALLANNEMFVSPTDLSWLKSADLIVMIVLGGVGTLFGSIFGAFAVLALELVLEGVTIHWHIIWGLTLVVTVLFFRQGLFGSIPAKVKQVKRNG
jgi:branched-chain amino acid transport system permease protein